MENAVETRNQMKIRKKWEKGLAEIEKFRETKDCFSRYTIELTTYIGNSYKDAFIKFASKTKIVKPLPISESELHEAYREYLDAGKKNLPKRFYYLFMQKFISPIYEQTEAEPLVKMDLRARHVMIARYFGGKKLEEIAPKMNLSREGVRQLEEKAICALRAYWLFESKENS